MARKKAPIELVFVVEEAPEGGFTAHAAGESIFTEANEIESLRKNILEAVRCHYAGARSRPRIVRLHLVRDEILRV